jgi:hypothetical protein
MQFQYHDGGRAQAGYTGKTGDCVTRAIAIAAELPYQQVYDSINGLVQAERKGSNKGKQCARTGLYKKTTRNVVESFGWFWHPTMFFGQGCKVHLRAEELPAGRLIVQVSKHLTAVIDGVIFDTFDPSRNETRCVYGYWTLTEMKA